jgi:uncharacterized protein with von Willebrand factor type A (vWA) domain
MSDSIDEALDKMEEELNQPPLVGVVLDKSGSMLALQDATITSFNELLQEQQRHDVRMLLTLFDTTVDMRPIEDVAYVSPLDRVSYAPDGMTALLDAIGLTVAEMDKHVNSKRVLAIITDGAENASKEYKHKQVREIIENRQANGWDVLFLGAGMEALKEAEAIGVAAHSTAGYSHSMTGTQSAHTTMSNYVTRSVTTPIGASNAITDEERDQLEDE